jgi:hypothetical protein
MLLVTAQKPDGKRTDHQCADAVIAMIPLDFPATHVHARRSRNVMGRGICFPFFSIATDVFKTKFAQMI